MDPSAIWQLQLDRKKKPSYSFVRTMKTELPRMRLCKLSSAPGLATCTIVMQELQRVMNLGPIGADASSIGAHCWPSACHGSKRCFAVVQ
jgi:hypothetical protein